jgi:anti-anti-sigma factor
MVDFILENDTLTAFLRGDIDHHSAKTMREKLDYQIANIRPRVLVLDFKDVGFTDSSGIGLVMGRYKAISALGGEIKIENTSVYVARMLRLGGIDTLFKTA